MNLTCSRAALAAALKACASVADAKSPQFALSMVRLTSDGKVLRCSATDINLALTAEVPCDGTKGEVLAPAAGIAKAVELLPGDEVSIAVEERSVVLRTGRIKQVVPVGPDVRDFPKIPVVTEEWQPIEAAALVDVLRGCLVSVCEDETRFHLCGVMLETIDGVLTGRSTDGHRAHLLRRPTTVTIPPGLIPTRGCERIVALVGEQETVEIASSDKYRHVRAGGMLLSVKIVESNFPPFDRIVPDYSRPGIAIGRSDVIDAMRRVRLAVEKDHGAVIDIRNGELSFQSRTRDSGFAAEETHVAETGGTELRACISPQYLSDAARVFDGDSVALWFKGELDPITITAPGADITANTGDLLIVMPMRLP